MASGSGSSGSSTSKDIGWKYAYLKDPKDKLRVTCNFCQKEIVQGIYRLKMHLAQYGGDVTKCPKCPENVRDEVRAFLNKNSKKKRSGRSLIGSSESLGEEVDFYAEGDADEEGEPISVSLRSGQAPKPPKRKNLMDHYFALDPADVQKKKKGKQLTINTMAKKEEKKKVDQYCMRYVFRTRIPISNIQSKDFKILLEAVGQYGPGYEPPSYYQGRVRLLKEEVEYTKELIKPIKDSWAKVGCTLMSDGWTDRRSRTIINFLVNSPSGTVFVESVDASSYVKTAKKLFELLDSFVEKIGEDKVIQVVTDNASTYVSAGKMLMEKRRHLYWTPCAAHCLDLILEDIGKVPKIKSVIRAAIRLSGFIYNHCFVLNLMRKYTNDRDLVRPAVTRFATSFLTLQSIYKKKDALRKVFTSDGWNTSRWLRDPKGRKAMDVVLSCAFWNAVTHAIKISAPLVRVLRLVDGDKLPPMGYIYEAMERAKEAIKKVVEGNVRKYKPIWDIIDKRWNTQLHQPLHAAGYFLNPAFFYSNNLAQDSEVMQGMLQVVERLADGPTQVDEIEKEMGLYMSAGGLFGRSAAIRSRTTMQPVLWWNINGATTPNLQAFAIKVLGLTCSSSGCERNWSVFEQVPSLRGPLKVAAAVTSGLPDVGANARGWTVADKFRPRLQYGGVLNNGNGNPDFLGEQNRGPRTNRSKSQWMPSFSVEAYTTREGASSTPGKIIISVDDYNKEDFPANYSDAKFFVIKSYSEDDVHKSIKYNVWSSTPNGNKRLDCAFEEAQRIAAGKPRGCPVFLFFSVNASGQFCGVAEMIGPVDFNRDMNFWQQDKWSGSFPVKWHIIKDVPNNNFRRIILENNENKPVTNSRDTQEIQFKQGMEMLNIFKSHSLKTSILDDFMYYEDRQKIMQEDKARLLGKSYDTSFFLPAFVPSNKPKGLVDQPPSVEGKSTSYSHPNGSGKTVASNDKQVSAKADTPNSSSGVVNTKPDVVEDLNNVTSVLKIGSLTIDSKQAEPRPSAAAATISRSEATDVVTVGSMPVKVNGFSEISSGILTVGTIPIVPKATTVVPDKSVTGAASAGTDT